MSKKKCNFANFLENLMQSKSSQSLSAAQKLLNDHVCATQSIHCSYYAVFQYMKYFLAHVSQNPLSYEQQEMLPRGEKSSHEVILVEVKNRLHLRPCEIKQVAESIRDLKQARVRADYYTDIFSEEDALSRKAQAEGLIGKLKRQVV